MNPQRYFLARSLVATGIGVLLFAIALFLIKVLLEVAYVVSGGLALAGVVMLVAGILILRL